MPVGIILSIGIFVGIFVGVLVVSLFLVAGNLNVSNEEYWQEGAYIRARKTDRAGNV